MSSTLFALIILQGTSLTFSPGYTTAAECLQAERCLLRV